MAARVPKVWSLTKRATLEFWVKDPKRGERPADLQLDSDEWFQWLELPSSMSFRFEPADLQVSSFTARKESRTDSDCWYAYKQLDSGLHECCIGVSEVLTLARLREVGSQMLQLPSTILAASKQSETKEAANLRLQPQETEQLKQEIQSLQEELAKSRQSYLIAYQEYQETILQLRNQNQRLQTERDQLSDQVNHLYASTGELKLNKFVLPKQSEPIIQLMN